MKPAAGVLEGGTSNQPVVLFSAIALAMLVSAAVLWLATGETLLVLAYVLGLAVLFGGGLALQRVQRIPPTPTGSAPMSRLPTCRSNAPALKSLCGWSAVHGATALRGQSDLKA